MAASEEELLLMGLFGEDAERLLRNIRGRASADEDELASVDKARAERIREVVRIVQESGIGEVTIEEDGHARLRALERRARRTAQCPRSAPLAIPEPGAAPRLARVERPRPRRVADGRHVLPCARAGVAAVRRGGRRRRRRARRSASSRR